MNLGKFLRMQKNHGPLDPKRAFKWSRQLATGLNFIHNTMDIVNGYLMPEFD